VPLIFTSADRVQLRSLPFGEPFWLGNASDTLSELVERMLAESLIPSQIEQLETAAVLELPRKVGTMYQFAPA